MQNLTIARLGVIAACRIDLMSNAIDVAGMTVPQRVELVREHLEYFQLMLADDSTPAQILSLIRRETGARARRGPRLTGRGVPAAVGVDGNVLERGTASVI